MWTWVLLKLSSHRLPGLRFGKIFVSGSKQRVH
jgi:hypothetical protein